jgi:hypothetical protein
MVKSNEGAQALFGDAVNFGIGDWTMDAYADYNLAPIELRFPSDVTEFMEKVREKRTNRDGEVDVEEIENPEEAGSDTPND